MPKPSAGLRRRRGQISASEVANYAVRVFLARIGERYDEMRGLTRFTRDGTASATVLRFFSDLCPYCDSPLISEIATDHLVPTNQTAAGLHAWGNVVEACRPCNRQKREHDWRSFVRSISATDEAFARRVSRIEEFQRAYGYSPSPGLEGIAAALYEGVAALLDNSYKSAEPWIAEMEARTLPPHSRL